MTILIAVLLKNSVLFLSDTLRNKINSNGAALEIETMEAQKIRKIRTEVLMSTAGIGTQGHASTELIKTIIGNESVIPKQLTLECCVEILTNTRNLFIKYNPLAEYNDMAALIGGIDDINREPYLYMTRSDEDFLLREKHVVSIGVEPEASLINEKIVQFLKDYPNENSELYANIFAKILQESVIGSIHVGQHVFVWEIRNSRQEMKGIINEKGIGIQIPNHFS